ncbi:hypothetical protein ACOMHN_037475 [Nucella lapillus]
MYDNVNLIIVSDHGMSARSCSRQVKMKELFNTTELQNMYVFSSASGRISNRYKYSSRKFTVLDPPYEYKYSSRKFTVLDPPYVSKDTILSRMSGHPHIAVYDKSRLPSRLHYANNDRIDDVVVKMDDGWVFSRYGSSGSGCSGGTHGWDSRYNTMSGLFIARGPAFKQRTVIPPFENIEIYNLLADVLQLTAAPNNGTRGSLHSILKTPPPLDRLQRDQRQCLQQSPVSAADLQAFCNCSQPSASSRERDEFLQPVLENQGSTICFTDAAHTTGYSTQLHMPLYTSFTLSRKEDVGHEAESCIIPNSALSRDERGLYRQYTRDNQGVTAAALFTASSGCGYTALSSDVLPMTKDLQQDLWQELWHMVRTVVNSSLPSVSVTLGPVFDHNHDGLADDLSDLTRFTDSSVRIPLPSHYFAVLARCPAVGQRLDHCASDLDLLTFVLPNQQNRNGQSRERRLLENVARVRDVELLTGLRFFADLDPALSARLRTQVPVTLWRRAGHWADAPLCPHPRDVQCDASYHPLLLVSLDGFRADYLVKYNRTPTLDKLIQCGVHAPYMRSVYPTKTFPNHYTIVTGLYPESHGIVDNNMYDLGLRHKFCLSCDQAKDPAWWGGQPIWLTAKHQGLQTATYFWPGSDVAINGEYPDHYKVYKDGVSFTERVQTVLQWLKLPAGDRPHFLTLYFDEPDHTGHAVGPDSPQIGDKLAEVDAALSELMEGLYQRNLHHCVNIVIIADHGMSGTSCDRLVPLSADISRSDLRDMYVYDGPVGRISNKYHYGITNNVPIVPPKINISSIVNKLECSEPHMRVYTKESMPMRHHYTNNARIDDVLLDADDRWLISRSGSTKYCNGGNHGYDNLYASMHALFVAYGPVFKVGVEIDPFENIELYNLMADILGVTPAPNNGTEGVLWGALRETPVSRSGASSGGHVRATACDSDAQDPAAQQGQGMSERCDCSLAVSQNVSRWRPPLGEPEGGVDDGPAFCVKHLTDSALGYNTHLPSPAWVSFNVRLTNSTLAAVEESAAPCVVRDRWLPLSVPTLNASLLHGTHYLPGPLRFGFRDQCQAALSSQMVPMLAEFRTGLWRYVEQLVADYSVKYGDISVTVGPVFNDDASAVWRGQTNRTRLAGEVYPVPTHLFVVLGRCGGSEGGESLPCWESLQLLSFLIPQVATPPNCQSFAGLLRENVARVKDIEIATGLRFFPKLALPQSARLRTFLPTRLWEGSSEAAPVRKPGNWTDQECPTPDHADSKCPSDYRPVLVVSLDGFKPQYLGRGLTPVMDRLRACGVHSPYLRSVYPTKTFPNHYTIVTGLYPESHGIIDNNMYDFNISQERFSIASAVTNDPRWWGGEPIWLTAQKQNVSSASFFWVGSDVPIQGSYPDRFKYYTGSVPYSSRVRTVVEWMQLPADRRPELMLLYLDEPDHQAHTSGPFTPQVDEELRRVDRTIGELLDALYQHDLHHCVNLMLLSDHGFSSLSCDQVIEMQDHFNQTEKNDLYFYYGPFGRISNTYRRNKDRSVFRYDKPPMSVQDVLGHLLCVDHLKAYDKADLPVRHHYANNQRIDNVILDPQINWTVADKINRRYCSGGSHGWDNTYRAMEALFVGYGPAFRNGATVAPFENIELYNMISDLLGIQPAPNNGTAGSLDHLLWRNFTRTRKAASSYGTVSNTNISSVAACNCTLSGSVSASAILQALTPQAVSSGRRPAVPFGPPLLTRPAGTGTAVLLQQPAHLTAHSAARHIPLWASATLASAQLQGNLSQRCAVTDPRLSGDQCAQSSQHPKNVSLVSLLPLGYDLGPTASLLSSQVPMWDNFLTGVWQPLQGYLNRWSAGYQDLNVIAGPAFDGNHDGLADTLDDISRSNPSIPTHIFVIASRCDNRSQPVAGCSNLKAISFILPQVDTSKDFNCQSVEAYLVDNEARVRDVELITGLHFFPALPFPQAVALRTFLPSGLWPL